MSAAQRGTHLALQGPPDPLKTCAHPWLPIPEHTPLPHVPWARLEVQGPRSAATRERPVERLALVFVRMDGNIRRSFLGGAAQPPLVKSVALGSAHR